MCINFNGSHSGGSSFVNVNDCWLLQKLFVYHRDKFSSEKKNKKIIIIIRSPSIWFRTPKLVRIRQSGRTGIGGVTSSALPDKMSHPSLGSDNLGLVMDILAKQKSSASFSGYKKMDLPSS